MKDFYSTSGGRRLCDSTLPEIVRQLKRVADEMRRANRLKEHELGLRPFGPGDAAKAFMEGYNNKGVEEDMEGDDSLHSLDV